MVVLCAVEAVVHKASVAYPAVYLHPAIGERNVLEVDESGAYFRHRTSVVAQGYVAAGEVVGQNQRLMVLHACLQKHTAVFHRGIKLLEPYPCRSHGVGAPGFIIGEVSVESKRVLPAGKHLCSGTPVETLAEVKLLCYAKVEQGAVFVGDTSVFPRTYHVWRGTSGRGVQFQRCRVLQLNRRGCHA